MEKNDSIDRYPKQKASGLEGFWAAELGLCITYFCLGLWELLKGLDNPRLLGWIPGGLVYMIGMLACSWLVWLRRDTRRNAFLHILLFVQLAEVTQRGCAWWADEKDANWPVANSVLAIAMVILVVWEARSARKAAAREADCEQKLFELDDTP